MTRAEVDHYAEASGDELLLADGFDDCILGIAQQCTKSFVVYDRDQVLRTLMARDGMSHDEAVEFFDVNIVGAWVGDATPAFLARDL